MAEYNKEYVVEHGKWAEMAKMLKEEGIVIIPNVMAEDKCKKLVDDIEKFLIGLNPSEVSLDKPMSFDAKYILPTWGKGMYGTAVSNSAFCWKVRTNEKIIQVYKKLLKVDDTKDLVVSGEHICYIPKSRKFRNTNEDAHIDVSDELNDIKDGEPKTAIYQGQVILAPSEHCFRISTRSHKVYSDIVPLLNEKDQKLPEEKADDAREKLEEVGGKFQKIIRSPAGSLIIWDSRCLSSNFTSSSADADKRCVVYLTYRRQDALSEKEKLNRFKGFIRNENTGHLGTGQIITRPFNKYSGVAEDLIKKPSTLYEHYGIDHFSDTAYNLACGSHFPEILELFKNKKFEEAKTAISKALHPWGAAARKRKSNEGGEANGQKKSK